MADGSEILRRRALRIDQDPKHPLYIFSLTGEELLKISDISRISRDDGGKLLGYQRGEVRRHIQEITEYLNSPEIVFPNSIILALHSNVRFIRSRGPETDDGCAVSGTLEIQLPSGNGPKPAWIVDGQQRAIALSKSKRPGLPVPVNAFVADEISLQRDQFLRVNNSRPLPRGLITELLPEVSTDLPARMAARRIPSAICDWLNQDQRSPFRGLIRRPSQTKAEQAKAVITDTSLIKVLEESLGTPNGCLYPFRNIATGETDFESISQLLLTYWTAVKKTFPEAWGKTAEKSRLMHGTGLRAMGRLMDKVMPQIPDRGTKGIASAEKELALIAPMCQWTSGQWDEMGGLKWNELQNVPRHVQMLSWVLIHTYLKAKEEA
ncbi:MAG: DGQHR domain-containing protein DpdB [Solirubrobacterales bacterium]|nr:DGQHR domain-containing protein DpdB [Solirubrobacterales bacterium]